MTSLETSFCSEDEIGSRATINHLIKENKMKEEALKKASHLIQLLTKELQNERNSKEEELRELQINLRQSYQPQLEILLDKMTALERELNKVGNFSTECETREINSPSIKDLFANFKQPQEKKQLSMNKIYSKQINDSTQESTRLPLSQAIFKSYMRETEDWKSEVVQELKRLTLQESEGLAQFREVLENIDYQDTFQKLPECPLNLKIQQLSQIIERQQTIISQLKKHLQMTEMVYKERVIKLEAIIHDKYKGQQIDSIEVREAFIQTKLKLINQRKSDIQDKNEFIFENTELKNIIENMIILMKEHKKEELPEFFY